MPVFIQLCARLKANGITKGHLHDGFANATLYRPGSLHSALFAQCVELLPGILKALCRFVHRPKDIYRVTGSLKLWAENLILINGSNGKGNQSGRYILIQECTGHGILAADCSSPKLNLCIKCT